MNAFKMGSSWMCPIPTIYGEFGENANASDSESFEQNSPSHNQQTRKNTGPFPISWKMSSVTDSTTNQASPHWYQNVHGLCAAVEKATQT